MASKEELVQAVNFLVLDPSAPQHFDALRSLLKVAALPVQFTGDLSLLNPLVELYRDDRDAFQRVLDLVDNKRSHQGWPPLQERQTDFDRNEYQREFMHQKRARERRIAEIENMSRPERDRLIGTARLEFMRRQSNVWKKRRDALLEASRKAQGGTLSKEQTNKLLSQFWEQIDAELDEAETEARSKIRGW